MFIYGNQYVYLSLQVIKVAVHKAREFEESQDRLRHLK